MARSLKVRNCKMIPFRIQNLAFIKSKFQSRRKKRANMRKIGDLLLMILLIKAYPLLLLKRQKKRTQRMPKNLMGKALLNLCSKIISYYKMLIL